MKKILLISIVLIAILVLSGCDKKPDTPQTSTPKAEPPHVHAFGEWTVTLAPTCDERGTESRLCECGETEERRLDKLGHNYTPTVTEPTCTEGGYTTYTCVCGKTRTDDKTEKLGHDFTDWSTTVESTCTSKGEEKRGCNRCDFSVTRDVDKKAHDLGDWEVVVPPTCDETGGEMRKCKSCSLIESRPVDSLGGHDMSDWTVTAKPTCTEKGVQTRHCKNEGCDRVDEISLKETGHSYGSWRVVIEPVCNIDGEERKYCANCSEYESKVIKATGNHTFGQWSTVKEPVCGSIGERVRACTTCGYGQMGVIPAKGAHSFGVWRSETPSTETRECNICQATEKRRISFGENATVEATTTAENTYYEGASTTVPYRRQGGCFNGINYYQALITKNEETGRIMKKNVLTGEVTFSETVYIGHGDDVFYIPATNCIYVGSGSSHYVFDADTLEYKGSKRLGNSTGCLYYLPGSNKYVNSYGSFYDKNFNKTGSVSLAPSENIGKTVQGHCADDNYIYTLRCQSLGYDSKYYTYIQIHTIDGRYVDTVKVEIPENFEPENISVVNGEIYIAVCTKQPIATLYRVVFED